MDGLIIGVILIVIAWRAFAMARVYVEENKPPNNPPEQSPDTIPEQADASQQIDIIKATDSLSKTDKDGNPLIASRLSGIYALERIAKDNITHHVEIMQIICAYIRHNSPNRYKTDILGELQYLGEDIKAAIHIIAKRGKWSDGKERLEQEREKEYYIDLNGCHLLGADLRGANLINACLNRTNLRLADFHDADLSDAQFIHADMSKAIFRKTNLKNTNLGDANLSNASLHGADFSDIENVGQANMSNAWLKKANLSFNSFCWSYDINMNNAKTEGAYAYYSNLSECENLTQEQLDKMFCGEYVSIPANLKRPKHWPTENLDHTEFKKAYKEWLEKTYPDIDNEDS
ncbi:MAG: pentapeptide repeat-containing protein [Proteobacteria bacterium]|nr:pentapeptide repeat-containing protein [Pseudomonadota bacterium]